MTALNFKPTKENLRKLIYIVSILAPSLLTGNIFSSINEDQTTGTLLASINALTSSVYRSMTLSQSHFQYSLKTLLKNPAFYTLDIASLSTLIAEFQFYNTSIKNAYMIDSSGAILYGINDTEMYHLDNVSHIDGALKGTPTHFSTFIEDEYFLQMAFPIFTSESLTTPSAALVLTYDFTPFHDTLEAISMSGHNISAYLFEKNGKVITSSTSTTAIKNGSTIDIDRVKLTLDLDPASTFTLFDNESYHGTYYEITGELTLLVTTPDYTGIALQDLIGFLMGALGLGGAATSQALKADESKSLSSSGTIDDL